MPESSEEQMVAGLSVIMRFGTGFTVTVTVKSLLLKPLLQSLSEANFARNT